MIATEVITVKRQRLDGLAQSWFDEQFVIMVAKLPDVYAVSEHLVTAYE